MTFLRILFSFLDWQLTPVGAVIFNGNENQFKERKRDYGCAEICRERTDLTLTEQC